MLFNDFFTGIEGQKDCISLLNHFVTKKMIPSALMFYGPEGVGKFLIAQRFARALHCKYFQEETFGNMQCPSCRKAVVGNHPDILILDEGSKIIKIDEIRMLIQTLNLKAFESESKVLIINNAENMTNEAANAILKTLEEPPKNTHIILIVSNLNEMLSTIKSRCVRVRLKPLQPEDISLILQQNHSIEATKASEVSLLASGSLKTALELSDDTSYAELKEISDSVIKLLEASELDPEMLLSTCEVFDKRQDKEKLIFPKLLDILYLYWRDVLVLNSGVEAKKMYVASGRLISIKANSVFRIMELIETVRKDLVFNINLRLAIEYLILEMRKIIEKEQENP